VAVVQDGTTRIQKTLRTTLGAVAADVRGHEIAPPAVIVVGPVAGLVSDGAQPTSGTVVG
jgi:uroporphyrin-III C-methyltransferase/precorrin-2 dehydrogenase/sirohydrochlorin ferrochelatase